MVADLTTLAARCAAAGGHHDPATRRMSTSWRTGSRVRRRASSRHREHERRIWRDAYRARRRRDAPWQHFVAYDGDTPVATTSRAARRRCWPASISWPRCEARGRGIGAAVTRAAMRYARDAGATQAALQSSELGFGVYRALGFDAALRGQRSGSESPQLRCAA